MLATAIQKQINVGNVGKIANANLRIEIRKRELKDGSYSIHGVFRERGKGRKYVGYISTKTIGNYTEAVKAYTPKDITKRQIKNVAGVIE